MFFMYAQFVCHMLLWPNSILVLSRVTWFPSPREGTWQVFCYYTSVLTLMIYVRQTLFMYSVLYINISVYKLQKKSRIWIWWTSNWNKGLFLTMTSPEYWSCILSRWSYEFSKKFNFPLQKLKTSSNIFKSSFVDCDSVDNNNEY